MAKETPSKRAKPASGPPRTKATLAGTGQTQPAYAGSKSELAGTGQVVLATVTPKATARAAQRARRAQRQRTRAILRSKPAKAQKRSQPVAYHPPTLPKSKPPTFTGHKTAGAPTQRELSQAKEAGTLKVNKAGFVTTPKIRQTARKLKQAKQVVHKTTGITGPLVPQQKRFVRGVAKHTKLSPRAVAAQALAEESGSAAQNYEASGEHNYLNIGPGQHYGTNREAVRETSHLLNTSPNYAGIRAARGKGPQAQVQAIGASPWGTVLSTMEGTLPQVGVKHNPKAVKHLKAVEAQAQELGLNTKGPNTPNVGPPPKRVVTKFKAIKHYAHELTERHIPYVWGGGHGGFEANPSGLDCSGAVSWVLHKAGVLSTPLTSGSMGSALKPGPGAVTVFYNAEHTFMRIGNEYWGTSVGDSGAGGLGPHPTPSASYLAQYNVGHVPGLGKKQALQLGINPGSGGSSPSSFPGMTLSSSGTTATINQGAGTTQSKPGFTNKPIRLTIGQKVARVERKLRALGPTPKPKEESQGVTLADLERKYGKAAV